MFMEPRNRFQGTNSASLCSLAGWYDNTILTRFLAPIDCLKIPAQATQPGEISALESILGILKNLKIWARYRPVRQVSAMTKENMQNKIGANLKTFASFNFPAEKGFC
jgi:hypothetical protein